MEGKKYTGQMVFGLDIGTRSIVGTVGYKKGDQFIVVAQRTKEHETRAMLDGQIHDIAQVGRTIEEVKVLLEDAIGSKLENVCIAAAGRVLRTVTTHVEYPFTFDKVVEQEDIYSLISEGVEKAYKEFLENQEEQEIKFYCVGHSVVRYYLNGYPMGNLEGHKARTIGIDLIATFLPDDVVDGLYRAVEAAGLKVCNLTLEPIAAIGLAIPEKFRMLNIALLDVGAGTTDISITNDGCILAYGMIPVAGDALTEIIAKHCLVEFSTAEYIKRQSCEQDEVTYTDIMMLPQKISASTINEITKEQINQMAADAADKIVELNGGKSVSAVFIVGGGGKMPEYAKAIAAKLNIAPERVAIRGEEVMQQIIFEEEIQKDSLLVTPVGICLNFYEQSNNFIFVNFNGKSIKVYDNNKLTVADAAIQAQFPNEKLFPRRGKELNFTINGKQRMIRGLSGEAAIITVNGSEADINATIHENDIIRVIDSTVGEPASQSIGMLPENSEVLSVIINGKRVSVPRFASVNGKLQSKYYEINENDNIEILNYYTVAQIAEFMDIKPEPGKAILVNNVVANADTAVYENFTVSWTTMHEDMEVKPDNQDEKKGEDVSNEKEHKKTDLPPSDLMITVNSKPVTLHGKSEYVYVDVFEAIEFDLSRPRGKSIVTNLNDRPAQYMEALHSGDVLEIYWQS